MRHLQTRFILAGVLLVALTIGSGVWSALTFVRLYSDVGETLRESQETIDLSAEIASSLEREDDALLLFLNGDTTKANRDLELERQRGDARYESLLKILHTGDREELALATTLRQRMDAYRLAGDGLLRREGKEDGLDRYHRKVNPLLRAATGECDKLREANFRSMQQAGIRARDQASRGIWILAAISAFALLCGIGVAVWLARSVLYPVRQLTASVEEIRHGNFDQRIPPTSSDELGQLATGFNRMAEALSEYRRSSLGELLSAKMTLEATLDSLPEAVLVFGPERQLVAVNPPARAVLGALGVATTTHLGAIPFSTSHRETIEVAISGKKPVGRQVDFQNTVNVTVEGQPRRYFLTAAPIPEFTLGRTGAVVVLDDVTELARLDELRSELIGVASHELKSPLTALRMNLLMLDEKFGEMTSVQQQLIANAVQASEELGVTIEELLDVTRIEAGQLRLNLVPVDLAVILGVVRNGLQIRFDDAGVMLIVEQIVSPGVVMGDPARLGSVLANVLSNALKYSPAGGVVAVRLSGQNAVDDTKPQLQITVTDQGPGIPVEYRERVFEKFFRVEHHLQHLDRGVRGTGIGLYLCREVVKAHGGTISCEPGDGGIGTRFVITLPTCD